MPSARVGWFLLLMPMMSFVAPDVLVGKNYLVESSGELLQVFRDIDYMEEGSRDDFYFTAGFDVYKLKGSEWIEVKSLGERSLPVSDMPGCRPDSIYFTDDNSENYLVEGYGPCDIGVFNLEDKSIEPLYPMESKTLVRTPIFIPPTMR